MTEEHRVLTPESVEFTYELGGLGSRMVAAAVDHLIVAGTLFVLWILAAFAGLTTGMAGLVVSLARVAVFVVVYAYFVYFEWRWNGQTPGKRLVDLRVIDDRGLNLDLFQAFVRNLFRLVDMMPIVAVSGMLAMPLEFLGFNTTGFYAIGGITALLSRGGKRLGDWAAGTLVIRVRKPVRPGALIAPSERYNTLQQDPSVRGRIRTRLTLEEREMLLQLCLRRNELELEARQALFGEAAAYLEGRLSVEREAFLSEEKFVQNIAAVALSESERPSLRARDPALVETQP